MNDREQIKNEHRQLIQRLVQKSGLTSSAIAKKIGKPPSTLNKILDDKHTHVLSTPILRDLAAFEESLGLPADGGSVEIDAEVIRDLLNAPHDKAMLMLWTGLNDQVKRATLDVLEAVTRVSKVG